MSAATRGSSLLRKTPAVSTALRPSLRAWAAPEDGEAAPAKAPGRIVSDEEFAARRRASGLKMPAPPKGFAEPGAKVYGVQDQGVDVQGIAFVDRASGAAPGAAAALAVGDVAALLVFAAIGRGSHHEAVLALDTFLTAAPFVAGWVGACLALDGYGKVATGWEAVPAGAKAAQCWAVGIPAGLALRGLVQMRVPPTPFVVVSMSVTFVLLVGYRSFLASRRENPSLSPEKRAQLAANKAASNKKGNPFDLVKVIGGLTGRW